jgi:hypothetical protein
MDRVIPTGGQVEPSAQLRAVPIGYNPVLFGERVSGGAYDYLIEHIFE